MTIGIDEMATFCKKKGFVYVNSEIYGGMAGFFDYGPLGSEMKNNLKQAWWHYHVTSREDIVGIDGSIITHPKVWVASGHVGNFLDLMLECKTCKKKLRADIFIEEKLNIAADGLKAEALNTLVKENSLKCPCGGEFKEVQDFNLMFKTFVGPKQDKENIAYLRPETAQLMFADFKQVVETARLKLPFGIAQMGRSFRNEISPRNFLFRCREFEQMEIEYFIHPEKTDDCPFIDEALNHEITIYSAEMQEKKLEAKKMTIKDALDQKIIKTRWHGYWLANEHRWFISLGANPDKFRIRQHLASEKSHYALDTWDLEYEFPFGWKELQGMANRTDFDLNQHIKHSGKDLSLFDEETKKKIVPYVVAEPSQGVDRAFLVFMYDAYTHEPNNKERDWIVLKLHPKLAPIQVGIFPLVNKLENDAKKIFNTLKTSFRCSFDRSGKIGKRYARADEIGIPFTLTIDYETLEKNTLTIRDRNTTRQIRVSLDDLNATIAALIEGKRFEDCGKLID